MVEDIWGYPESVVRIPGTNLTGYKVEAIDGTVGTVEEAAEEVGAAHLVVNCKPWLLGKHVLIPAGTVTRVDHTGGTVHVGRTREQVKDAPAYTHATMGGDAHYRATLGTYYRNHNR